jgi:predicted amino acid-binding ACT domain protein
VELVAEPAASLTLEVALEAALACSTARPDASLLDWLAAIPPGPLRWNRSSRQRFFDLLEHGTPRSWRLLVVSGVLERALPELGAALSRRQREGELDPLAALHLPWLRRLQADGRYQTAEHPEWVLLAALVLEAADGDRPVVMARKLVQRLDLGAAAEQAVARLVADADLLTGAARRLDGLTEESVLQLAAHLGTRQQAWALYLLSATAEELDSTDRARLDTLDELVAAALAHPELVGREATNTIEQRRAEAIRLVGANRDAHQRLDVAPRAYLLATAPADLARQAALCDPLPRHDAVRTAVTARSGDPAVWWIDVVARDRPGLLARQTGVLASAGVDVIGAISATWGDGCALSSFLVDRPPADVGLTTELEASLGRPLTARPLGGVTLEFDDVSSPWHTICTARARDQRGLLHAVTTAFAVAGANVHAARVRTAGDTVVDVFELTDTRGAKLGAAAQDRVRELLAGGVTERSRWARRRRRSAPSLGDGRTAIDPLHP